MLERRRYPRRRVCLEAAVTDTLFGAPKAVQIRSLSAGGAELVIAGCAFAGRDLALAFGRESDKVRAARIVWRKMETFGVEFGDGSRLSDDGRPGPLSRLMQAVHRLMVVFWI